MSFLITWNSVDVKIYFLVYVALCATLTNSAAMSRNTAELIGFASNYRVGCRLLKRNLVFLWVQPKDSYSVYCLDCLSNALGVCVIRECTVESEDRAARTKNLIPVGQSRVRTVQNKFLFSSEGLCNIRFAKC